MYRCLTLHAKEKFSKKQLLKKENEKIMVFMMRDRRVFQIHWKYFNCIKPNGTLITLCKFLFSLFKQCFK